MLYTVGGDLLTSDGKLASSEDCCCEGRNCDTGELVDALGLSCEITVQWESCAVPALGRQPCQNNNVTSLVCGKAVSPPGPIWSAVGIGARYACRGTGSSWVSGLHSIRVGCQGGGGSINAQIDYFTLTSTGASDNARIIVPWESVVPGVTFLLDPIPGPACDTTYVSVIWAAP